MIKGEMQFVRWDKGTAEFSMTLEGGEEPWLFVNQNKTKSFLFTPDRKLVGESIDVRPRWRRWLSMLGPVAFQNADGSITCKLDRIGWSSDLRYVSGSRVQKLKLDAGFTQTHYESRSLKITMQEDEATVAQFEFDSSLSQTDVMLMVGHLVAYHCRL
jgi:hypothetical protein